jgi:hypothetical protein
MAANLEAARRDLCSRVLPVLEAGPGGDLGEPDFNDLALALYRFQFEWNPVYGAFCRGRGLTARAVDHWSAIPPVPTSAFKSVSLATGPGDQELEAVFRTSGTTRGTDRRGEHPVVDLRPYHAALESTFRHFLIPDSADLWSASLIPDPARLPDSSLSHMVGRVSERLCAGSLGYFADPDWGMDLQGLGGALDRAVDEDRPVLLMGTAFGFVHWLDELFRSGQRRVLPAGSRIMETGGFKGRSREIGRAELYEGLSRCTGIPPRSIVNEYGMTELGSQFYEPSLRDPATPAAVEDRWLEAPPWVRSRVLDPVSLEEVGDGHPGILAHLDLANLNSVAHVLTEDRGIARTGGFSLLGRSPGAEPRGCSLTTEEILRAGGGTSA